jgi:hypothetical protein
LYYFLFSRVGSTCCLFYGLLFDITSRIPFRVLPFFLLLFFASILHVASAVTVGDDDGCCKKQREDGTRNDQNSFLNENEAQFGRRTST